MFKGRFSKEQIKRFFNFERLITESVLKYVFIGLLALAAIGGVMLILSSWITVFKYRNFFAGILTFLGVPIMVVIGFLVYGFILRIGFESVLIRFLVYREIKKSNTKANE